MWKLSTRRSRGAVAVLFVIFLCASAYYSIPYLHALRLLNALQSGASPQITGRGIVLRSGRLSIKAKVYMPSARRAPVLVLVHGVHYLGIEEPRLQAFARALAREGVLVITPEIAGIKDYRVTPEDIAAIGESVLAAQRLTGAKQVGLMGLSFSGGLSLMAAADPRYAPAIGYVIAVGAHASMRRVAQFYGTNEMLEPDGRKTPFAAHEYGELVVVYEHPEDFFPAEEVEAARSVLKPYLQGDVAAATAALVNVRAPYRATLERWINHHREGLGEKIVADADTRASEMDEISPEGHLGGLRAPVLLLHGAGDSVIPPSETDFLVRDLPPGVLDESLISPALSHVDMKKPGFWDELRLLRWMGEMFRVMGGFTTETRSHGEGF